MALELELQESNYYIHKWLLQSMSMIYHWNK